MSLPDLTALWLTARLALVTTVVLLIIGTPLAWWLAQTRSRLKPAVEALIALPLVLPPTVLGFYLLIAMSPNAPFGGFWLAATGDTLSFSFAGLVIGSVIYSFPFMIQPLQSAFEGRVQQAMRTAASLRASRIDAFFSVAVPMSARGFVTAIVLSFAHTLGEFGVVLMVGGNIPDRTRVTSIEIYENVETLNYADAHALSLILLVISFVTLFCVFLFNKRFPAHVRL
ncbi:MAG: molybdate ABC transporter permease subunit [Pseudomonadota bacterium]